MAKAVAFNPHITLGLALPGKNLAPNRESIPIRSRAGTFCGSISYDNLLNRGEMTGYLDTMDIMKEIGLSQGKSGLHKSLRDNSPIHVGYAFD